MSDENKLTLWQAPDRKPSFNTAIDPKDYLPLAVALRPAEQTKIIDALSQGFYDLAAEFVWTRSLARLKSTLGSLGMSLIGEMLGRPDIKGFSTPESVLTDFETIRLAEQLGVLPEIGALRLRHAFELLSFVAKGTGDHAIDPTESLTIVKSCVQYVLAEHNLGAAMDFVRLRDRLMHETLNASDPQFRELVLSPLFFLRTVLRVLISAVKDGQGSVLDHALGNSVSIIPQIWEQLGEDDRWAVGQAYADVVATGKARAITGLRELLLLIKGFDYVPESLRSNTFKQAARAVLDAHFSFNNFFNEEVPVRQLGQLGSVIPQPAFIPCVQALMVVALGNYYGVAYVAGPAAVEQLSRIGAERLIYFYERVLEQDDILLSKLGDPKPASRFCAITRALLPPKSISKQLGPFATAMVDAAHTNDPSQVIGLAKLQSNQLRHRGLAKQAV